MSDEIHCDERKWMIFRKIDLDGNSIFRLVFYAGQTVSSLLLFMRITRRFFDQNSLMSLNIYHAVTRDIISYEGFRSRTKARTREKWFKTRWRSILVNFNAMLSRGTNNERNNGFFFFSKDNAYRHNFEKRNALSFELMIKFFFSLPRGSWRENSTHKSLKNSFQLR